MSANITAASTSWRRTGCSVTSAQSSGSRQTSKSVVPLADLAVLRQRAAGLAHEPDRRALDRLAARRADEERFHQRPRLVAHGTAARGSLGRPRAARASRRRAGDGARRARERRRRAVARRPHRGLVPLARRAAGTRSSGTGCAPPSTPSRTPRSASWTSPCGRRSRRGGTGSRSTSSTRTASGSPSSASRHCDLDVDVAAARRRRRRAPRRRDRRRPDWEEQRARRAPGGLRGRRRVGRRPAAPDGAGRVRAAGTRPRLRASARLPVGARRRRGRAGRRSRASPRRGRSERRAVALRRPDQSSTAIRSSTRVKTNAPSASATTAAAQR